jgi:hypothetical protein
VILPLVFLGGVFYSIESLLQPALLSGQRDPLRVPGNERRERRAVTRGDGRARGADVRVGPVALHERATAEGLSAGYRPGSGHAQAATRPARPCRDGPSPSHSARTRCPSRP